MVVKNALIRPDFVWGVGPLDSHDRVEGSVLISWCQPSWATFGVQSTEKSQSRWSLKMLMNKLIPTSSWWWSKGPHTKKITSLLGSLKLSLPQADLCSDDSLKAHLTFNMSFKQHIYSIVSGFHRLGIPPDAGDCDGVGGDKPTLRYMVLCLN